MSNSFKQDRRAFMGRMGVMSGVVITTSVTPFSSSVFASSVVASASDKSASVYPAVDTALENYPGYSANIGYGRAHLVADAGHNILDMQLLV